MALGIEKKQFEITSYLFDAPESNYKGVIGLDFLADKEFCIDLKKSIIKIQGHRSRAGVTACVFNLKRDNSLIFNKL